MAIPELTLALTLLFPQAGSPSPNAVATDGPALLQANRPAEARAAFEEALGRDPSNAAAQAGEVAASERLALQARAAGHIDDALQILLRARNYAPQSAHLLYDLGIIEDEMRLFQDADRSLSEADHIQPSDANTIYGMARVKLDLEQLAAAEEKMKAYLTLRPNDSTAHFGLGRIYQIGLQPEKAKVEFLKSAELRPVQTEAYFELGDLALKDGEFDEAIIAFAKTLERDPKHGGALEGTGEAYFKKKDFAKAEDFLERAVSSAPDYSPSHYYLGLTLTKLGRKSEAEKELALAAKLAKRSE
jgi:tetratricopeptide (TPR) repeat protein